MIKEEYVYKPNAPCLNCPNRKIDCHNSNCPKWAAYEIEYEKWHKQQDTNRWCENLAKRNIEKYSKPHANDKTKSDINQNF